MTLNKTFTTLTVYTIKIYTWAILLWTLCIYEMQFCERKYLMAFNLLFLHSCPSQDEFSCKPTTYLSCIILFFILSTPETFCSKCWKVVHIPKRTMIKLTALWMNSNEWSYRMFDIPSWKLVYDTLKNNFRSKRKIFQYVSFITFKLISYYWVTFFSTFGLSSHSVFLLVYAHILIFYYWFMKVLLKFVSSFIYNTQVWMCHRLSQNLPFHVMLIIDNAHNHWLFFLIKILNKIKSCHFS